MRLLYLAPSPIPSHKANTYQVAAMCDALVAAGDRVTLICPTSGPRDRTPPDLSRYAVTYNLEVRRSEQFRRLTAGALDKSSWSTWRGYAFRFWIRMRRFEAIICRHFRATPLLSGLKMSMAFEIHHPEDMHFIPATLISAPHIRWIFITRMLRDAVMADYPHLAGRIGVLPDAGHEIFDCARSPDPALLRGTRRPRLALAASASPGKGHEQACHLAQVMPEMDFHLFGVTLADLIVLTGTPPPANVRCHGVLPQKALFAELREADVLLAPFSRTVRSTGRRDITSWMSPLKVFEYMSVGVPIVASDLPVLREVLAHNRNALLAPPEKPEEWAITLRGLLADPKQWQAIANAAFDEFQANHTYRKRAQQLKLMLQGS